MTGDPVRDEAERLVATAIAAVSLAARGLGGVAGGRRGGAHAGFATGSAECCVCPVCRVISAMRDPSPDLAERLASGAGDLAAAVTGILRSVSKATRPETTGPSDPAEGDAFWEGLRRQARDSDDGPGPAAADPWRAATTGEVDDLVTGTIVPDAPAPRPMAKKAVKKAVKKAPPAPAAAPPPVDTPSPAVKKVAKKAVAKTAVAKKAVAKKAVAKKAAKKASPAAEPTDGLAQ